MLTFMNSKLRWLAKTSKTTFSKKVNPMKYSVLIYRYIYIHSHFWPFNFMCAFNRKTKWKVPKLTKIWKKCHIHHKKKLLKRKGNSTTPAETNAPISQTSSKRLKLKIQTDQMRNKELKNKAWTASRGNIKSIFTS